jgi:hypothetical protein
MYEIWYEGGKSNLLSAVMINSNPPPPTKLKRGAIPVVNTGAHKG